MLVFSAENLRLGDLKIEEKAKTREKLEFWGGEMRVREWREDEVGSGIKKNISYSVVSLEIETNVFNE